MKHKKFNEPYPYTYYITHKSTGLSYYGVRIQNYTKYSISPLEDLGKIYYTSLGRHSYWFRKEFIKNPLNFHIKVHYTFDTPQEAYAFEKQMITKLINKKMWLNKLCIR